MSEVLISETSGEMVGKQCLTKAEVMGSMKWRWRQVEAFIVKMILDSSAGREGRVVRGMMGMCGGLANGGGGKRAVDGDMVTWV